MMVGTPGKSRTNCGVFRQPRQDILHGSVSQCVVSQESLCKVSDFEISVHSKYNLPELYTVDGQGRAIYWLYKHSLADRESVKNCKAGSIGDVETTTSDYIETNPSVASEAMNGRKAESPEKGVRFKGRLSKLRDLFLSSTTSDIEIKETYNSYIDLTDIETVDGLLKDKDNLSLDKYDNLMMNLELKKLELEKKQLENYKKMYLKDLKEKESRKDNIEKYLGNLINIYSKPKRKRIRKSKKCDGKNMSVMCKSTETDLISMGLEINDLDHILNQMKFFMQSGKMNYVTEAQKDQLEGYLRMLTEEADRNFSKKEFRNSSINRRLKNTITESIRDIILTTELKQTSSLVVETNSSSIRYDSVSLHSTNSLRKCQASSTIDIDSDTRRCQECSTIAIDTYTRKSQECSTIDIDCYTRKCQECSTIDIDTYTRKCQECSTGDFTGYSGRCQECSTTDIDTHTKRCQECSTLDISSYSRKCQASATKDFHNSEQSQACTTLNIDNYPHSLPVSVRTGESNPISNYHSVQTNTVPENLSEKEIQCEVLRCNKAENVIEIDSTDELIFKRCQLDDTYDLLNFSSKGKYTKNKSKIKDVEAKKEIKMDKFKSVRNFNESDTFKYLEIKQKEKCFKHKLKYSSGKVSNNICLIEPDSISCSSEIDKINDVLGTSTIKGLTRREGSKDENKPGTSKSGESHPDDEEIEKLLRKLSREKRRLNFLKEELKHGRLKKSTTSTSSLKSLREEDETYAGAKEKKHSDSENECKKERSKSPIPKSKSSKNIKSSSFTKSKNVEYGRKNEQACKEFKVRERKEKEKKKSETDENRFSLSDNCIKYHVIKPKTKIGLEKVSENKNVDLKQPLEQNKAKDTDERNCTFLNIDVADGNNVKISHYSKKQKDYGDSNVHPLLTDKKTPARKKLDDKMYDEKQKVKRKMKVTNFIESMDSTQKSEAPPTNEPSRTSNHIIRINNSLIHLDEKSIFKATESESMESFLKNEMLSKLHKSLVPNKCETSVDCSVNIPIYKRGCEIARITRQSPSCAYSLKKYVQKLNKSTQMFEHVTRNDLYTLQWIHDNLFEINLNPHTLIIDEKIKEVSEMSDVSS